MNPQEKPASSTAQKAKTEICFESPLFPPSNPEEIGVNVNYFSSALFEIYHQNKTLKFYKLSLIHHFFIRQAKAETYESTLEVFSNRENFSWFPVYKAGAPSMNKNNITSLGLYVKTGHDLEDYFTFTQEGEFMKIIIPLKVVSALVFH